MVGATLDAGSGEPVSSQIQGGLQCSPDKLSRNDVLVLKFGARHESELAVVRPDKEYFFVAQRRLARGARADGIPSEMFSGISELHIVPDTFRARRWRSGVIDSERLFDRPGKYVFLLGENLESEHEGVQSCEVTLADK